jgi:hypothetical protein
MRILYGGGGDNMNMCVCASVSGCVTWNRGMAGHQLIYSWGLDSSSYTIYASWLTIYWVQQSIYPRSCYHRFIRIVAKI